MVQPSPKRRVGGFDRQNVLFQVSCTGMLGHHHTRPKSTVPQNVVQKGSVSPIADGITNTCNKCQEGGLQAHKMYARDWDRHGRPTSVNPDRQDGALTSFGFIYSLYSLFALPNNSIELSPSLVQRAHDLAPATVEVKNVVLQLLDPALLDLMRAGDVHGGCELGIHGEKLDHRRRRWRP